MHKKFPTHIRICQNFSKNVLLFFTIILYQNIKLTKSKKKRSYIFTEGCLSLSQNDTGVWHKQKGSLIVFTGRSNKIVSEILSNRRGKVVPSAFKIKQMENRQRSPQPRYVIRLQNNKLTEYERLKIKTKDNIRFRLARHCTFFLNPLISNRFFLFFKVSPFVCLCGIRRFPGNSTSCVSINRRNGCSIFFSMCCTTRSRMPADPGRESRSRGQLRLLSAN